MLKKLKKPHTLALIKNIFGLDGGMDGGMDAGWTVSKNFGTGWSRKVDGMVTEGRRDGHGKWTVSGQNRKI
jgi:hypothetical protein